jgi:hypothetical protein
MHDDFQYVLLLSDMICMCVYELNGLFWKSLMSFILLRSLFYRGSGLILPRVS